MARKKVVLVIVEGPSDDTALGIGLNQVFDKDTVHVHIMHGDITTRDRVISQNIVSKIGNIVRDYAKSQHYKPSDFKQIIHIVDTDGTYISDENIIEKESCDSTVYESEGIYVSNRETIIKRNQQKRDNLYRLRTTGLILSIPYKVYYMSCNLDHVLYDKRNSTDEEKENDAYEFAKRYRSDLSGFIKYICDSDFSVKEKYKESWEFIEKGMNSLERHTNLGICIDEERSAEKL